MLPTPEALRRTVRALCSEIQVMEAPRTDWWALSESDLFFEACLCICSSQVPFEAALAIAHHLRDSGLLEPDDTQNPPNSHKAQLQEALSHPVRYRAASGRDLSARPRFRNRLASLLGAARESLYFKGPALCQILRSSPDASSARRTLAQGISGFGPKQASLFLQRIGFAEDFAIVDTHVLDYMLLVHGVMIPRHSISRLSEYEKAEHHFQGIAAGYGFDVNCVDLAVWVTMRTAKQGLS